MSQLLIQHYLNQLADLRKVSGTNREMVVREAFKVARHPTFLAAAPVVSRSPDFR